jgi:FkbM family methyltransferase
MDPEPQEITALRPWLKPGSVVFDLGAHQAVVALMLADIVGPNGRVVAVEAYAHNADVARRNCALNNADNVEVVHAAVAASSGVAWFTEGFNGHVEESPSHVGKSCVPALTIDELADQCGAPDALLIDVEGQELRALQGAGRTLASDAAFVVEVHSDRLAALGQTTADVIAALGDRSIFGANIGQAFEPLSGDERRFLLATCS